MVLEESLLARRQFLKMVAGSPLLHYAAGLAPLLTSEAALGQAAPEADAGLIGALDEALEVMDFESLAQRSMLPAHWGYLATGVDGDGTLHRNQEAFANYELRPRRLVDYRSRDMSIELLGGRWKAPLGLCPIGSLKAFHTQGDAGAARAAQAKGNFMMLSSSGSTGIEEVNEAYGEPVWYQLYVRPDLESTDKLIRRVEAAGCSVLVWTIDLMAGRNTITDKRAYGPEGMSAELCTYCHRPPEALRGSTFARKPMQQGLADFRDVATRHMYTWDFVERLKDTTDMKVVLKGIVTREDAERAVEHGADGLIVSNHGGRATESLRASIDCLPEVAAGVAGRIPILLDGGIRRGTDIFKALALGADAVAIGRPFVWGLAAYGQDGVEKVIDILHRELFLLMAQMGARSIEEIRRGGWIVDRRTGERL